MSALLSSSKLPSLPIKKMSLLSGDQQRVKTAAESKRSNRIWKEGKLSTRFVLKSLFF
jgi:hypothetical protein